MVAEVVMPDVSRVSIVIYWKTNSELDVYLDSGTIQTYKGHEAQAVFNRLISANFPVEVIE